MAKAYVIFTETIKDEEGMAEYLKAAGPSIVSSGAKVLAGGPASEVLEGDWHGEKTVVLEFESLDAARAWYRSPEYTRAKPLRQAAAETNAVIVEGV